MLRFLVYLVALSSVEPVRGRFAPLGPHATQQASHAQERNFRRQDDPSATICGYTDGDPSKPRGASPDFVCLTDPANGLWGFCHPGDSAELCLLVGVCTDQGSCTSGCGKLSDQTVRRISCASDQFCSTALLIESDQSLAYIACGREPKTESIFVTPNDAVATTTSSERSGALDSSTPATQTSIPPSSTTTAPSSANVLSGASLPPPTSNPTPESSEHKPNNIGPIVGGVLGGLTVICLTILGVFFIRRKRGASKEKVQPSGYTYGPRDEFSQESELSMGNTRHTRKAYQWDSSRGPVEMSGGHHVNMEPVELPGRVH